MKLAILVALAAAAGASAQEPVVELREWRVQVGDDPRWAAPDFDDSGWARSDWPKRRSSTDPLFAGTRWYRTTVVNPDQFRSRELAIGLGPLDEVFEVYVDGVRVGGRGDWQPEPKGYFPVHLSISIPRNPAGAPLHVAIRRWTGGSPTNYAVLSSQLRVHPPLLGQAALIELTEQHHYLEIAYIHASVNAAFVAIALAGLLSLAIFFGQRARAENLWLGLTLLAGSLPALAGSAIASSNLPLRAALPTAMVGLAYLENIFSLFFLAALCPRIKKPLYLLALLAFFTVPSIMVAYGWQVGYLAYVGLRRTVDVVTMIAAATTAFLLTAERRHRASILLAGGLLLSPAAAVWYTWVARTVSPEYRYIPFGDTTLDLRVLARLLMAITALAGLYLRNRAEQERQAVIDRDLGAARMVQDSLLTAAAAPGFTVDAVYLPAQEVGGDFYVSVPGEDGSQLIVTGDVSGKGLPASLLVAAVVGATGNLISRKPADVLAHLSLSVHGKTHGGFITCCCALFYPNGTVEVANAGHLSPYLDGQEVPLEAGLPLGILREAEYRASTLAIGNGRLTFVSDGIVEAANSRGELFGFERAAAISGQSAKEIAEAARAWGQNDDITVVTVGRAAA